jgi:hypothetical protein
MVTRLEQLVAWGLPAAVVRLAGGDLPHPAFAATCEPLRVAERQAAGVDESDQVRVRPEVCRYPSVAMWEHDVGDGHAFEVVYCVSAQEGLEFWHVTYADDMPCPDSHCIARSVQGLYFWLFFYLIQSEFFGQGEGAYNTLVAAAKTVGFKHLAEVFRLEGEVGSDYEHQGQVLRQRALAIT